MTGKHDNAPAPMSATTSIKAENGTATIVNSSTSSSEEISTLRQQIRFLIIGLAVLAVTMIALLIVMIWMAASFSDQIDENEDDIDAVSGTLGLGATILSKKRNGGQAVHISVYLVIGSN